MRLDLAETGHKQDKQDIRPAPVWECTGDASHPFSGRRKHGKEFRNETDTRKIAKTYRMDKNDRHGAGDGRDRLGNTPQR